jgi:hypothetical protein
MAFALALIATPAMAAGTGDTIPSELARTITSECGKTLGECKCVGEVCGEGCCPPDHYCSGGNICLQKCAGGVKGQRCGNDCCRPSRASSWWPSRHR